MLFWSELSHSAYKLGELIFIETSCLWVGILVVLAILLEQVEHSVKLLLIPRVAVAVFFHELLNEDLCVLLGDRILLDVEFEPVEWLLYESL